MKEVLIGCLRLLAIGWRLHRAKLVAATALVITGAVAAPFTALSVKWLVNEAVAGRAGQAALAGVVVAVLAIAAITCSGFAHIAYFELSELSMLDLECELIALANGSEGIAHHERPEYADKLITVRQGLQRLRAALESLLTLVGLVITVVVTAVLLAQLNPLLLLLIPLAIPPLLTGRWAERVIDAAKLATAEQSRLALGLFRLTTEAGPAKELRLLRLQDEVVRRHRGLWDAVTGRLQSAYLKATAARTAGQLLLAAGYLGGVLLVVRDAVAGSSSVGDVVLSVVLAAQVNIQIANAVTLLEELQALSRTMAHLDEMREVVGPNEQHADGQHADGQHLVPARLTDGIELDGVSFAYSQAHRPVLRDLTVRLPAGATVAVVGENGAGKSSLVKLLCGFYAPTSGRILLDGVDLRERSTADWRARIAAGFQDFVRFEFTARESVGVGDLPQVSSDDAVLGALRRAESAQVVAQLPDGLRTNLGRSYQDGAELSGGQWQKIALGRSFMREQPLLVVLDEPTSALDAEAEHFLFERYADQARRAAARTGAVTVLVSHRFSTVRMADLIIVLRDGAIEEAGDHATLMARGGLYADLFGIQAKAYE